MRPLSTGLCLIGLAFALVALGAGCSGDDATDSFEQEVVAARNAADGAFAYIKRPESTDDLIERLRTSGDRLANASGSITAADAPEELAEERRRLARALSAMSREMDAAANSIELVVSAPSGSPGPVETLVFDTWDTVQAALTDLRNQGINVLPLRPGGGP